MAVASQGRHRTRLIGGATKSITKGTISEKRSFFALLDTEIQDTEIQDTEIQDTR
jgi:hypothetical protein